jgi:hypothetical protein
VHLNANKPVCEEIIVRIIKSRQLLWLVHVAKMEGDKDYICRILVGKHLAKLSLRTQRRRWEDKV